MSFVPASPPTPRRARRALVAALAVAAVAAPACASEADLAEPEVEAVGPGEFEATSSYLAAVASATDGLTYRISMDMSMRLTAEGGGFQAGGTFATGEVDGDVSAMTMDFGEMFGDIAVQAPGGAALPDDVLDDATMELDGLTMEMVTDGTTGYIRAPFFRTMADMAIAEGASRADLGPLADLADLGDTWGRIDLSRLSPSQVASAAGGQTPDPRTFLDIAARGSDVRELGTDTIDSVEVRGLGATVSYGDMLEAQGADAEALLDQMAGAALGGDDEFAEVFEQTMEAMLTTAMPIEVWVDGEDHVRRISLTLDMSDVFAAVEEATGDAGAPAMSIDMVMDFTDYGDDSIRIEIPTDAVDVTDLFLALMEGGGLGTGTGGTPLGG